jgi:hypothetical protein
MTTLPFFPLRFRTVGTELQFKPYPSYPTWLLACDLSDAIAAANAVSLFELPFAFNSAYPLILLTVPALATIISVRLEIETLFDVAATITVGDAVVPDRLMSSDQNNPFEVGLYETSPDYEYSDLTTLVLLIDAPGATTGAGRIIIQYDKD